MEITTVKATETEQQVYEYSLYVKGLFGRNRKVKGQSFVLAKDVASPLTSEQVETLVTEELRAIKIKDASVTVREQPMTLQDRGNGFVSRAYVFFSDRVLGKFNVVAGVRVQS